MQDGYTLVIETSTAAASIMRIDAEGDCLESAFTSDRQHNSALFGPLSELLDFTHSARFVRVIVGSGPASYSGTRVGIAAAQGVAIAHQCPAVAMPSILAVPTAISGRRCYMIGDARRGHYWFAEMAEGRLISEPVLIETAELTELMDRAAMASIKCVTLEKDLKLPANLTVEIDHEIPSASRLWQAWQLASDQQRAGWSAATAQPIYLKPPHITPAKPTKIR